MKSKKGAEFTIGMVIALILGLVVLVVIALGFTMGWQNLWEKMNVFAGGSSISTVGQACQIACSAQDKTGYCIQSRTAKGLSQQQMDGLKTANAAVALKWKDDNDHSKGGTAEGFTCVNAVAKGLISACQEQITCDAVTPPVAGAACAGTATACSGLNQADCTAQKGCTFANNACSGTATACAGLNQADCTAQKGCSWA